MERQLFKSQRLAGSGWHLARTSHRELAQAVRLEPAQLERIFISQLGLSWLPWRAASTKTPFIAAAAAAAAETTPGCVLARRPICLLGCAPLPVVAALPRRPDATN